MCKLIRSCKRPQTAESGKKLEKEFGPRSQELDRLAKQIKELETVLEKEGVPFLKPNAVLRSVMFKT